MKREMSIDEVKQTEIEILNFINEVASENDIQYYLAGGTLLGAIRHKGFIPWDDDIDIIVPRRDYRKLIDSINNKKSRYKAISAYDNKNYRYLFFKVVDTTTELIEKGSIQMEGLGVYVDVFPLDNLPDDPKGRKRMCDKAWNLRQIMGHANLWKAGNISRGFIYKTACAFCELYGWKRAFNKFERMCDKTKNDETLYCKNLTDSGRRYSVWNHSSFIPVLMVEFEGKQYPAASDYNDYLKGYGNFMELPPIEKRVSNHSFVAYKLEQ